MGITNDYITFLVKATMDDSPGNLFTHENAHLGVGDSSAEFNPNQTDLQAATNKVRVGMNTGYPIRAENKITFQSTFGDEVADFVWAEWGTFNHATAETMANRKVQALGTKSGGAWLLEVDLTLALGVAP